MFCSNCGKETRDDASFCEFCGKELLLQFRPKKKLNIPLPAIIGGGCTILVGIVVAIILIVSHREKDVADSTETVDAKEASESVEFDASAMSLAERSMEGVDLEQNVMDQHVEKAKELGTGFDPGKVIADFTFFDADGKDHHITEFVGKTVYYNFFTSWCPYCVYEIPDMNKVIEENGDDVVLIMVDIQETSAEVDPFVEENGIKVPVYYVEDWIVGGKELPGVPVSVIVDKYGVVHGYKEGMSDYDWMSSTVKEALAVE